MKAQELADELDDLMSDSYAVESALAEHGPDCDVLIEFRRRLRDWNVRLDSLLTPSP